jgi:dolichol kinase
MTGESKRQIEHMLFVGFAFLLRYLSVTQAVICALAAVAYGLFGSQRLNRAGVREDEAARGYSPGKLFYALSVLALVLIFRERMHITAGAWAVMALGDGASNLAGRAWGRKKIPWSETKTWVGGITFFLVSWAGAFLLVVWTAVGKGIVLPPMSSVLAICAGASVFAALVESLPWRLDDNITTPAAAAVVLAVFLY